MAERPATDDSIVDEKVKCSEYDSKKSQDTAISDMTIAFIIGDLR